MDGSLITFFTLATLSIAGSVFMMTMDRLTYQAYAFGLAFFSIAILFLLQGALILSILHIVIHVGLLLIWVPFLRETDAQETQPTFWVRGGILLLMGLFLSLLLWLVYQVPSLSDELIAFSTADLVGLIDWQFLMPLLLILILQLLGFVGLVITYTKGGR